MAISTNITATPWTQMFIKNKSLCYWLQQVKTYDKHLTALRKATRIIAEAVVAADHLKC